MAKELNLQRNEAALRSPAINKGGSIHHHHQINGPNVIIIGPCDEGKSTLAKIMINYAINEDWSPMYVDLDVGQGAIGVPGMIGAGIVDQHCHLDSDYQFRDGYPLMVHFGGITPDSDKEVYQFSVSCLAHQINRSLQLEEEVGKKKQSSEIPEKTLANLNFELVNFNDRSTLTTNNKNFSSSISPHLQLSVPRSLSSSACKRDQNSRGSPLGYNEAKIPKQFKLTKWSGLIINTHGWIFDYGYESTMEAICKFSVSTVLVLGDYRLYERIHRDLLGMDPRTAAAQQHQHHNQRHYQSSSRSSSLSSTTDWNVTSSFRSFNRQSIKVHFFQRNFSAVKRDSKLR